MFILLPVGVDYETNRLPMVTFSLMGANILVYLIGLAGGEPTEQWIIENLMLTPGTSPWYAYLTSMFTHAGFFHLLGNMIYLFLFGACVEDTMGRWKFLLFYVLGGIAADFGHIAATPEHFTSEIPLCGASGAITACLAGFLVLFRNLEIEFRYFGFIFLRVFAGEFSLAAWIVISFWFAKDLLFAALTMAAKATGGGVAFAAHVGGFIAGLVLIGLYKLTPKKPEDDEPNLPIPAWRAFTPNTHPTLVGTEVEPNEAPTIFVSDAGVASGPFTSQQVRQMLSLGSISAEAHYWREGMTEWATVQDFIT